MSDDGSQAVLQQEILGGMFGPNPYSQFPQGIQGTSYNTFGGGPTDAMGRPIQPPPGTTLNSAPAAAPAAAAPPWTSAQQQALQQAAASGQQGITSQMAGAGINSIAQANALRQQMGGMYPVGGPAINADKGSFGFGAPTFGGSPQPAAAPPAAAPSQQPTNSYQNALNLLSNPGKVTTPGATVPESQPVTNQPSVLQQFLASQGGGTGANTYSNQGFFNTLNKLKGNNAPPQDDTNVANTSLSPGVGMAIRLGGGKR